MNDESRALRHELAELCDRYKDLVADKDTIDFRLGSQEYVEARPGIDPEHVYEVESQSLGYNIRSVVVRVMELRGGLEAFAGEILLRARRV